MANIFFDTNLFIYLFESHETFGPEVKRIRTRMISRGDMLYTSCLTVGEALVRPLELGNRELERKYADYFQSSSITVLPFDHRAASLYASLRRSRSLRIADAVQLACAGAAGIDLFITNDEALSKRIAPGIHFITSLSRCPI